MGESRRRRQELGEAYGQSEPVFSWLPGLTKQKATQFVQITTTGAWIGIGAMVALWVLVRLVGPALHWWQLAE
ncbi:MAG: DUF2839 domain-containing protein [Pseudanabaenaceae cyanobacterium bins.68]|nr:DUF2839 domain-containing protein [Pseudanabaenaceae cyanobacterium bins.68]